MQRVLSRLLVFIAILGGATPGAIAQMADWPALPERDGAVELPAQSWPLRPGARRIRVLVHYPRGDRSSITPRTGVMLTLHNWGGTDCVGTADPRQLAARFNVIALCVNYLQSGKQDAIDGPEPYDFGYLQALDALRAVAWTCEQLRESRIPYASGRLYSTGGSGGGNVTLMAQKLAPRTFACVVDLCGMKKLSDDIAFNLPGGSGLNARYARDPAHPHSLTLDHQELRFLGNREHLASQRLVGATALVITVHGRLDTTCPFPDAEEMVSAMRAEGLAIEPHFIDTPDLDGQVFTSAGHPLGNRTEIVFRVAGKYLMPDGAEALERRGPSDFERREAIRYPTTHGAFVIDYANGYPEGRFEPAAPPPDYPSRTELTRWRDEAGKEHAVESPADWSRRRAHIVGHFERVAGRRPSPLRRVPLNVQVLEERRDESIVWRRVSYQADENDRVTAWLLVPMDLQRQLESSRPASSGPIQRPAVLCLHQTTAHGKDEPVGLAGDPTQAYARELAARGFVTISPDYPSLGEHSYDFAPGRGYASGTMKAAWDNVRAIDLLESLSYVDARRIGCVGHSLGGHNAIFSAVLDERVRVIVSSCGFTSLARDDVPSWTGPRYMPRLGTEFGGDARRVPFDFPELIAVLAPRPFLAIAATRDDDFDVTGVRECLDVARPVYSLFDASEKLQGIYPDAPHSFPDDARKQAYEFLEKWLMHGGRQASDR